MSVLHEGSWCDAEVVAFSGGAVHRLRINDSGSSATMALHPWNHAPRELDNDPFEELRKWWTRSMQAQHASIRDAISGKELDVLDQCVRVVVGSGGAHEDADDVHSLSRWLNHQYAQLCHGRAVSKPSAMLVTAPPAAGKVRRKRLNCPRQALLCPYQTLLFLA